MRLGLRQQGIRCTSITPVIFPQSSSRFTMPKYKLTYYNMRGRTEVIRWLFLVAGQEYEDIRVDEETWQSLKPNTQIGHIPFLEMDDGVVLSQSKAISRYLARTFGLAGKTELEKAKVDMIVDTLWDMFEPAGPIYFEKDEDKKAELQRKMAEEQLPYHLARFEKIMEGDYFLGEEVSWADLAMVITLTWPPLVGVTVNLDKFSKIRALKERVEAFPKIAEWIKKRPKTDH